MQPELCLIKVSIDEQRLQLLEAGEVKMDVAVATAANGPGEIMHSECTPRGWHRIRAKIGAGAPENTVFTGRRPTGEIYSSALRQDHPGRCSGPFVETEEKIPRFRILARLPGAFRARCKSVLCR